MLLRKFDTLSIKEMKMIKKNKFYDEKQQKNVKKVYESIK